MRSPPSAEEEFDEFFGRVRSRLLGQAVLLTGDRETAQDLAQEALMRAWKSWPRIRRYEDPEGWTRRVLHNLAVSHLRRRRRGDRLGEEASPGPSVDFVAVSSALERLPPRVRRVIVLHYYADLPVGAIARQLRVPAGTVKSWLSRGRAAIMPALRETVDDTETRGGSDR